MFVLSLLLLGLRIPRGLWGENCSWMDVAFERRIVGMTSFESFCDGVQIVLSDVLLKWG